MIKKFNYITGLAIVVLLMFSFDVQIVLAQSTKISVTGKVIDSGTGLPLKQVSVSVASTGELSETNEKGEFLINAPDFQSEIIFELPEYSKRKIFLNGRTSLTISLVSSAYKSFDQLYDAPLGAALIKDATTPISSVYANEIKNTRSTSFDQPLQGIVPGLNIVNQSGMPGSKSWVNIGAVSSLFGRNEPVLFIDGMIHDYNYAQNGLMEGFSINPFDIVDIEDISNISIVRNGNSYLGAMGSNGVIYVNTEQNREASTVIQVSAYAGVGMVPQKHNVLNASDYKNYLSGRLAEDGYDNAAINQMYPWLNGTSGSKDYYRYNNSTNWQNEIYKPGTLSKFHLFLKGGDDIATYNISAGYLNQKGVYEKSSFSRFNLRINGKINITDKFSITPNAKLSLADSYTPNQGYSVHKNPLISSLLIPSVLQPFARDEDNGAQLPYIDDVSVFNISNPVAIVTNAVGSDRNYHFLASATAEYKFSEKFKLSNLIGLNFNNARENIFIPDLGLVQVDSAANSPGVFVNEFRSTQNHTTLSYSATSLKGHSWDTQLGARIVMNNYKHNNAISLNTPSDDFKKLSDGTKYTYLRTSTGDDRSLAWVSYFANVSYNFRNKYYLNINASYDGNSANNEKNRYNLYPSVGAAWRLNSEKFLSSIKWIDDLKLRGMWSLTGNMYSSVYDYSKMYYAEDRVNSMGVVVREIIPNSNLELEKKATLNGGIDISLFGQKTNVHVDYFSSQVNNLIIQQELAPTYGYTTYFDNGGKLAISGFEVGIDQRFHLGKMTLSLGATLSNMKSVVSDLEFIKDGQESIITNIEGASFITKKGFALNSFYGYKTEGIFTSNDEAGQYIGPKGKVQQAGDIKFFDKDANKIINEADKDIIGDPNPDYFGGVTAALNFKNFELSALFAYSIGNDIFNYVRSKAEGMDTYSNQFSSVADRWTTSNAGATMPRAAIGDPTGNNIFSNRWIEDGSYFGLKKLTVSYSLPQSNFYKGLTLFVTASNLFTATNYSGYDPEFMYSNSPFFMGVDYGKMPHTRSFIFGIKLDL